MTTRAAEIVRQGLRELAQEEGASVGQVLSWAGAAEGADLITAGGGGAVSVLGPFTVAFDTPGFFDAADNGALVCAIPAGSLVRAIAMTTTVYDGDEPEIDISLAVSADVEATTLVVGSAISHGTEDAPVEMSLFPGANPFRWGFAAVDCNLYAALYTSSGTPSQGETVIYVVVIGAA